MTAVTQNKTSQSSSAAARSVRDHLCCIVWGRREKANCSCVVSSRKIPMKKGQYVYNMFEIMARTNS